MQENLFLKNLCIYNIKFNHLKHICKFFYINKLIFIINKNIIYLMKH